MNELECLLLASVLLSWLVASIVLRRGEHWQLVQSPPDRSSHVLPTANGSGLGIVVMTLLAFAPLVAVVAVVAASGGWTISQDGSAAVWDQGFQKFLGTPDALEKALQRIGGM